jgi:aspartate-semialdehyde dehydrogenase
MKTKPLNVALVEATNLCGSELKRRLDNWSLAVSDVAFLGSSEQQGTLTSFGEAAMMVSVIDEQSFLGVDVAFFCARSGLLAEHQAELRSQGVLCVDMAGSLPENTEGACLMVAGVNRPAPQTRLLLNPHPTTIVLAPVLAALAPLEPLGAQAVGLLPAAEAGQGGLEELQRQSVALLNFTDPPREVLGRQLAFNLIPDARRTGDREQRVSRELGLVLPGVLPSPPVTLVWVPTFMGMAAVLHVELPAGADRQAVEKALEASTRVRLLGETEGMGPVETAEDDFDGLSVGVLGIEQRHVRLWCVADHLRRGMVLNALEAVEAVLQGDG